MLSRRAFLESATLIGMGAGLAPSGLFPDESSQETFMAAVADARDLTMEQIKAAEAVAGLSFTDEERELMLEGLQRAVADYEAIRTHQLPNSVPPSVRFDPRYSGVAIPHLPARRPISWVPAENIERPASDEELAFMTVPELSALLRSRRVTSEELTALYLRRLKEFNPALECVVSLTEERAWRQARAADAELDAGTWRGPLHGIPWGAKDLLSVAGYPTTWGAAPYRDQSFDVDATVVQRLDEAGAVLVAKLTLGALAMGDVWFGGRTNGPWNIERGSSGSSAGSGAAVAAGLVGFAIGSETLGSIVSPSTRNGVTGLRPTYGRVSRSGAMALSWTMDKLGPMCRSAEGCALVFDAIHGHDPAEPDTVTTAFEWPEARETKKIRVGYLEDAFENERDLNVLEVLRGSDMELYPVALPDIDPSPLLLMLRVEAAAAFDELTLSDRDDELTRQDAGAWPNSFRRARLVPAVEYVNASRIRTLLMRQMTALYQTVDVIVMPSFGNRGLSISNLTGHPCVVLPHHFAPVDETPVPERRNPASITFLGGLYRDDLTLAVAAAYQEKTDFHRRRPPIR